MIRLASAVFVTEFVQVHMLGAGLAVIVGAREQLPGHGVVQLHDQRHLPASVV